MNTSQIGAVLLYLPILLLSVIVHECSHGLVALWRGDPTAKFAGRLTLNPIPHIDLYGSIILPGLLMLWNLPAFGWAKPVPVDARNFHHSYDGVLVAIAGPLSNLILGFLFAVLVASTRFMPLSVGAPAYVIGQAGLVVNCVLCLFNLLPIPPLDGHWVALRLLPPNLARAYAHIGFMGILLIFVLFLLPGVSDTLIGVPLRYLTGVLLHLAENLFRWIPS
ncbi:MAG TPA: site-2 protease family protein [Candidatus Eisenbacteria bacterium]|nr:site-2 protease family protein [Candidatus Eisenbacteria bacterium]